MSELAAAGSNPSENETDPAQEEASALASGLSKEELSEKAAQAEHRRNERFRDQFEKLAVLVLWLAALALVLIGSVWLAHMLMPARFRWLSLGDLSHLQSVLTAGLLVGIISDHFKKRLR